jgi:hypothetical protein
MFEYGNEIGIALVEANGERGPEVRVPVGANNLTAVQNVLTAVNKLLEKAENAS